MNNTQDKHDEGQNNYWEDDDFQFMRLLAEIHAVITFDQEQISSLCNSMDINSARIEELLSRADRKFENEKMNMHWNNTSVYRQDYTVVLKFHEDDFDENDTYTAYCTSKTVDDAVIDAQRLAYKDGRQGKHSVEMIFQGHLKFLTSALEHVTHNLMSYDDVRCFHKKGRSYN